MRMMITVLLALLGGIGPAVAGPKILFVGNSYTFANGDMLASAVAALVLESTGEGAEVTTVAKGGYTFEGHLADSAVEGEALHDLLAAEGAQWDYVVLQEQSVIPAYHDSVAQGWYASLAAAKELAALAQAAGATPVFLMTWGRREGLEQDLETLPDYVTMQGLLAGGYQKYVDYAGGNAVLAPAGLGWQAVYDAAVDGGDDPLAQDGLFWQLYSGDGSHPSVAGTALTALVAAATVAGIKPAESQWQPEGVSEEEMTALRGAAQFAVYGPPDDPVVDQVEATVVEVVEGAPDTVSAPDVFEVIARWPEVGGESTTPAPDGAAAETVTEYAADAPAKTADSGAGCAAGVPVPGTQAIARLFFAVVVALGGLRLRRCDRRTADGESP